ncbi:major egg antigen-like [Galendromus occidentalis]|uniref:Major egg antigen-like n=1 Tax=Galendromus occidentalis TaxID=34638 RepID=A0AAJ6VYQ1_9ACAR|nr:major egg antigen-like [Galendromus occidentalis]
MFEECCQNDMKSWFEKHIQRMEDELRSRNCYVNVDPQRSQRVFEEIFMSSSPRSPASFQENDEPRVLCELRTTPDRFAPEDVSVTVRDREVSVHASKKVLFDDGYSLQEVVKKFKVPEGFALDRLQAQLTDSRLIIKAPVEKRNNNITIKVVRVPDRDENLKESSAGKEFNAENQEKEIDTSTAEGVEEHHVTLKLYPKTPETIIK